MVRGRHARPKLSDARGGLRRDRAALAQGGSAVATPERARPVHFEFRGESTLPAGLVFENTVVGGLSSIAYDAGRDVYYAISDDQGSLGPVRVYTLTIDVVDGHLEPGDVAVLDVTALAPPAGETYAPEPSIRKG